LTVPYTKTSTNRAGVAEPCLQIWDTNLGQTNGQTDTRTDTTRHWVALQLKRTEFQYFHETMLFNSQIHAIGRGNFVKPQIS
jgi:hypothetical protein